MIFAKSNKGLAIGVIGDNNTINGDEQAIVYDVVVQNNLENFKDAVELLLSRGWKLQGGICVYGSYYYQAIYREVEDEPQS